MKNSDVVREFEERFCQENQLGLGLVASIATIEAFLIEKLNERGEMIAKEIEEIETFLSFDSREKAIKQAAAISRSYKE